MKRLDLSGQGLKCIRAKCMGILWHLGPKCPDAKSLGPKHLGPERCETCMYDIYGYDMSRADTSASEM